MSRKQRFPHLVGSKWTAQKDIFGWRHFQVIDRKDLGALVFAEVAATCDPNIRFWTNARVLQDDEIWLAGWQSITQSSQLS